jgi:hypothetical protein
MDLEPHKIYRGLSLPTKSKIEREANVLSPFLSLKSRRRSRASYHRSPSLLMKKVLLSGLLALSATVSAQAGFIESYTARLIARDHYNSNGERLESAAAIIRQNRANFYVYGIRTDEDEPDSFFSRKSNRALLEQLLEHGTATQQAINEIINETPLIRVDVYTEHVDVTVLSGESENRTGIWKN